MAILGGADHRRCRAAAPSAARFRGITRDGAIEGQHGEVQPNRALAADGVPIICEKDLRNERAAAEVRRQATFDLRPTTI